MWAIFIIHYGIKMYVTKVDDYGRFCEYSKTKCSSDNVLKYTLPLAKSLVDQQSFRTFKKFGLTEVKTGRQIKATKKHFEIYGNKFHN